MMEQDLIDVIIKIIRQIRAIFIYEDSIVQRNPCWGFIPWDLVGYLLYHHLIFLIIPHAQSSLRAFSSHMLNYISTF